MAYLITFIVGAVIGSFLNVCIHRIPIGSSIVFPPSRCPQCGSRIRAIDNIPIVSYILLLGRCRDCRVSISFRYPLIECLNGILYLLILWRFGISGSGIFYMAFSSALIVITFIDLDYQIIPDSITLPGILIGLLFASISSVWNITISANEPFVLQSITLVDPYDRSQQMGFVNSLLGIATGGGIFLAIAVISRGGMGGGDIKMMGMMGSVLGWKGVLMTTFAASLTGSVIGVLLMIFGGKGRKSKIPFGPFLALGGMISLLFGQELLWIYLRGTN